MSKKIFFIPLLILLLSGAGYILVAYYEYIFARSVSGVIEGVERVTNPTAMIGIPNNVSPEQLYSFAVAIKQKDGEIVTSSSEDRQWAVAAKGKCVEAKLFPYPPWDFDKAGTYHGARLIKLFECN